MSNFEESPFYVKSDDVGFASRQKSIFEQLDVAEKEKNERQNLTMCVDSSVAEETTETLDLDKISKSHLRQRLKTKHFRGKESIFKKPLPPPPAHFKHTSVPDYRRHPNKWTKYTLDDVSKEDMSDRSNTAAALSFLKEIQIRKETCQMIDGELDPSPKVVFRQPKRKAETQDCEVDAAANDTMLECDKPSFKCSKLIMPEYVVGQSKKVMKKKLNTTVKPKNESLTVKEVKLGHLMDEDDND